MPPDDPPAQKITPGHLKAVFDNRDVFGYVLFNAGKVAEVVTDCVDIVTDNDGRSYDLQEIESISTESVRRHLDTLADDDSNQIRRFEMGTRTVLYGKENDHINVSGEKVIPKEDVKKWGEIYARLYDYKRRFGSSR